MKLFLLLPFLLAFFLFETLVSDRPAPKDATATLSGGAAIVVALLVLAWTQTRNSRKFFNLSFTGWVVGFALSFTVGAVCSFFV